MSETNYVVKINTALSNKPFFVKITDPNMSIDRIFSEAVSTLRNTGRPLESQQIDNLYKQHSIFNNGKLIQKGDLFKDLSQKNQTVGAQTVVVAEIDLVTSHSGGAEFKTEWSHGEVALVKPIKDIIDVIAPDHIVSFNELLKELGGKAGDILEIKLKK